MHHSKYLFICYVTDAKCNKIVITIIIIIMNTVNIMKSKTKCVTIFEKIKILLVMLKEQENNHHLHLD